MIESPGRARHHGAGGVAGDPPFRKKTVSNFVRSAARTYGAGKTEAGGSGDRSSAVAFPRGFPAAAANAGGFPATGRPRFPQGPDFREALVSFFRIHT